LAGANSRFEAAFPFATEKEKEIEKTYIEKHFEHLNHHSVKGLWITSQTALTLARDYNIEEYIQALIDAAPNRPSDALVPEVIASSAETGAAVKTPTIAPAISKTEPGAAPRRTRRSVSPRKRTPKAPSSTTSRGRKSKKSIADNESVQTSSPRMETTLPRLDHIIDNSGDVTVDDKSILDTIEVKV
jgi:hypothetical protein